MVLYILEAVPPVQVLLYHLPQYLATLVEPQSHLCQSQPLPVALVGLLVRLFQLQQLRVTLVGLLVHLYLLQLLLATLVGLLAHLCRLLQLLVVQAELRVQQ